jgi:ferredoxin
MASLADKDRGMLRYGGMKPTGSASGCDDNACTLLSTGGHESKMARSARFERATPGSGGEEPCDPSAEDKGVKNIHCGACTTACTTEANSMRQKRLGELAEVLYGLTREDRATLARMLDFLNAGDAAHSQEAAREAQSDGQK